MRLALIGTGLIGGSAAWAMKDKGIFDAVTACDLNIESARMAVSLGFADRAVTSIEEALQDADAVMVAVPVLVMKKVFAEIGKYVKEGVYITDVGSTRMSVIRAAKEGLGDKFCWYAPIHPIAGGEMPGVEYSDPNLYKGCKAISTPTAMMLSRVVDFWEEAWIAIGSKIVSMSPEKHDEVFACVSHLPHVISYTMVDAIDAMPDSEEKLSFAGAGFRDFTRIAASSPAMWRDICIANKDAILRGLKVFERELRQVHDAIEREDVKKIQDLFERACAARRKAYPRAVLHSATKDTTK